MKNLILGLVVLFAHIALAGPPIIWNGTAAKLLPPSLIIPGSTSGTLTINPAASTTSYALTFPSAQGNGSTTLINDGSGGLTFGSFVNGQMLYVDHNRADTYTADGSIQRPYKTIQSCLNAPNDASNTKTYVCIIAGTNTYTERLTLANYVNLVSFNNALIQPTLSTGPSITGNGAVSTLMGLQIFSSSFVSGDPAVAVDNGSVITIINSLVQGLFSGTRGATVVTGGSLTVFDTTLIGNGNSALNMTGGTTTANDSSFSGGTNSVTVTSPGVFQNNGSYIANGSFSGTGTNTLFQKSSYMSNDSSVSGTAVKDALNTLSTSTGITNSSSVSGATVTAAFNTVGAYSTSSGITNSSGVSGSTITGALNTLNGSLQNVVMNAYKNAGSVTANTTIPTWTSVVADSLSAFNSSTGVYTVPASLNGNNLIVSFGASTTTGTPKGQVYKNGSLVQTCLGSGVQTTCPDVYLPNVATSDTVTVALDTSLTLTSTNTDTRLSISATPGGNSRIVKARYHGATGTITSSLSNITFSTSDVDNQSAYSGATYTIPATFGGGFYGFNFCVYLTATTVAANQVATCAVLNNAAIISEHTQFTSSASTKPIQCCVNDSYQFAAGDAVTFQASLNGTTNSVSASNVFNYFYISRVSN